MSSVNGMKTGKGILRKMKRILETPYHQRRGKFGRFWVMELINGEQIIREEYPELTGEVVRVLQKGAPKTVDDLVAVYP